MPPLADQVQGLLVRTYRMAAASLDLGPFILGDRAYRRFYGPETTGRAVEAGDGSGARTLIRETAAGLRACVYFPDAMIERLERHPPHRGLDERNVEAFATFVEELDHLLCVADAARRDRQVSLFELELHAGVSKYLVLARFLAGSRGRLAEAARLWLRDRLFHRVRFSDPEQEVRERYREAARWSVRMIDGTAALPRPERIGALRRFHHGSTTAKLRLIEALAG